MNVTAIDVSRITEIEQRRANAASTGFHADIKMGDSNATPTPVSTHADTGNRGLADVAASGFVIYLVTAAPTALFYIDISAEFRYWHARDRSRTPPDCQLAAASSRTRYRQHILTSTIDRRGDPNLATAMLLSPSSLPNTAAR